MTTFLLLATLSIVAPLSAADRPSKRTESASINTAHKEAERNTKLSYQGVYAAYKCEFFFYTSLRDPNNFGALTDQDRKDLAPILGTASFFLYRFTSKTGSEPLLEVFVSEDGKTIISQRSMKTP